MWSKEQREAIHAAAASWPVSRCPIRRCEDCDAAEPELIGTVMCDPRMDWERIRDMVCIVGPTEQCGPDTFEYKVRVRVIDYEAHRANKALRGRYMWDLKPAKRKKEKASR
jgi:hypothetical protein